MAKLTATQAEALMAVEAYEERYHKGFWAGRDGVERDTLEQLVDLGLLRPARDEHHVRVLYRLTLDGHRRLDART